MSMISNQCDKLLETADKIQRIKNNNADWLWRDATTLTDAAEQLLDAADLILELRDDLQRANAEKSALECRIYDRCLIRVGQLEYENAKLREVIDDITEVVEFSDPILVQFIAKRMKSVGIEVY